ncbi:Predicted oxidoreductase [Cohaesibacter marisflavi]|uniref:Predicted oxidoreductase n=1 Tax=Cohaesibacter marisflavi TaxID=655353 RepID=A0A1I5ETJ9_9HYPH|nr:aldo/keto reductase [Cohaesibacter marisflavi]SFO14852.1 Predicted oxidoreductase [Cohaesibacter marisflavi]
MEKKALGKTGFDIAPIVFGGNVFGWTLDEQESFRILDAFIDHGFDAIDTADAYSRWAEGNKGGESETILGKWFKARPGMRDKVKLFTKVGSDMGIPGHKGLKEEWILKAVDDSLSRLGVDYIDLYFSHWPDPDASHSETLGAYDKLLKAGKIRTIGASNYDLELMTGALAASQKEGLPFYQVLQPEFNLNSREKFPAPLKDFCVEKSIGVITYFSLASGFLTGKYRTEEDFRGPKRGEMAKRFYNEKGVHVLNVLDEVAANHDAKQAEVALAWIIRSDGITAPIASATSFSQIESFVKAVELDLTQDEMDNLTKAGL